MTLNCVYNLKADGTYDPVSGEFEEKLELDLKSIPKAVMVGLEDDILFTRDFLGYKALFITKGKLGVDPWLYYYPGIPYPSKETTVICEKDKNSVVHLHNEIIRTNTPLPLSAFALLGTETRKKLSQETKTAPKKFCDKILKYSLYHQHPSLAPRIISPAIGENLASGNVRFQFELPCEFSFGYGLHAFKITLERCVSGCEPKNRLTISPPSAKKLLISQLKTWEPVAIPGLPGNMLEMEPTLLPYDFRSVASKWVKIPFEGEGQLFRFKVRARLWDGKKFVETPDSGTWHYFWLGRNPDRPDFSVTEMKMWPAPGSGEICFVIYVKEQGRREMILDHIVDLAVECRKNGEPYPLTY